MRLRNGAAAAAAGSAGGCDPALHAACPAAGLPAPQLAASGRAPEKVQCTYMCARRFSSKLQTLVHTHDDPDRIWGCNC
eukprot:961009-Pelagomonas_calceolata.AAC.1